MSHVIDIAGVWCQVIT